MSRKANDFMSQIDGDVETPVAVAKDAVVENTDVDLILTAPAKEPAPANTINVEPTPEQMLPFEKEEPAPVEPEPIFLISSPFARRCTISAVWRSLIPKLSRSAPLSSRTDGITLSDQ